MADEILGAWFKAELLVNGLHGVLIEVDIYANYWQPDTKLIRLVSL